MVNIVRFTKSAYPQVEILSRGQTRFIATPFTKSFQTSPVRINPSATSCWPHSVSALNPDFVTFYFVYQIFVDVSMGPTLTDDNLLDKRDCTFYISVSSQVISKLPSHT